MPFNLVWRVSLELEDDQRILHSLTRKVEETIREDFKVTFLDGLMIKEMRKQMVKDLKDRGIVCTLKL